MVFRAIKSVNYNKESKNPILTLDIEGYGEVQIELKPDYAPNTVATIIKLVQNGYYDGKVFYGTDSQVVAAGMELTKKAVNSEENTETTGTVETAQEDKLRVSDLDKSVTPYVEETKEDGTTEVKSGDELIDYEISIPGEFVANGVENTMRFEKGTVGLYRADFRGQNLSKESYNSGKSLFFITTSNEKALNGEYTAFGKVIKGMDIIEKMLSLPLENKDANENNFSLVNESVDGSKEIEKYAEGSFPVIKKATVETYGIDYGMPEYQEAFDYNRYLTDLYLRNYSNQ